MHKPQKPTQSQESFIAGGGDEPLSHPRKKAVTVNRRNVTRTNADDSKLETLIDSALDFKDENGKRIKLNGSEASSLAVDIALYLLENDKVKFAEMLKWTKDNRIVD